MKQTTPKTLLVLCPMWDPALPPLGIAYLAAYLEHHKIPVDVLDINIEAYTSSDASRLSLWKMSKYHLWAFEDHFAQTRTVFEKDIERWVDSIVKGGYAIVGFSLSGANNLFSIAMAERLKKADPRITIVFGGPACFFIHDHPLIPLRYMASALTGRALVNPGVIDVFVRGEGEETLRELILAHGKDEAADIPGTVTYRQRKYHIAADRPLIQDLDTVPIPAWEKFPLALYTRKKCLPMIFSRGCVNKCAFCNDWKMWQGRYRCRSASSVFEEMRTMKERFDVNAFQCADLMINGNVKMLAELAETLIREKLNVSWTAQASIRGFNDLRLLRMLKKSGLDWITYGVESLSENVLKRMRKFYTFKEIRGVLEKTKKAKIGVLLNFIVGFPTETEEDFLLTVRRLRSLRKYIHEISSLNPCNINAEIDLEKNPQDYSLYYPEADRCNRWVSLDGDNTPEVRSRRVLALAREAVRLKIKVLHMNLFEDAGVDTMTSTFRQWKRRKSRRLTKWVKLAFLGGITAGYLLYLWLLSKVGKREILGGRRT